MKIYKKVVLAYVFLMLGCLAIMVYLYKKITISNIMVENYTDEELRLYRKMWDSVLSGIEGEHRQILVYMIIFWSVIFIIGLIFLWLVYIKEIKPVMEMKDFAAEIARGNLDVELPIHKDNMFGTFTESFDLMREELKASKIREMEADNAKRELVGEMSHDLKTPVATIKATCEVLDVRLKRYLKELEETEEQDISYEKKNLIGGVNDLIEKNGYIMNKSETINSLVQDVFHANLDDLEGIKVSPEETVSTVIEETFLKLKDYGNIILTNHIPECLVFIDRLRMEQVIDNVISNSYKYAGTDIYVTFENVDRGDNQRFIKLKIQDKGPGVSEEDLPLITNKYYRGKESKEKPGYGLGMYLVKWYMEKQHGDIDYYNDGGFVVELFIAKV
ncbi:MAG: HAMP domain-containing histidine kinase [Eubacterium sp.]|nr:HAMP domain-containing histidine kinase [Eubacterium sp.]